jgi:hypothetical protein
MVSEHAVLIMAEWPQILDRPSLCHRNGLHHCGAELDVDFGRKVVEGYAKVTVSARVDGPELLVLDTSCGMTVHSVQHVGDDPHPPSALAFTWGEQHAVGDRDRARRGVQAVLGRPGRQASSPAVSTAQDPRACRADGVLEVRLLLLPARRLLAGPCASPSLPGWPRRRR